MSNFNPARRGFMTSGAALGASVALPTIFTASSAAAYLNEPTGRTATLGFIVPQTGPYADEGADELRAYQLAVKHLNGEGDGGMMNTFSSKALTGSGVLGKRIEYVTGDTRTNAGAAIESAKALIENRGAMMITGGSSSSVAIGVQALCQETGIIFMAAQTHSNATTGKDRKANGFRHFYNAYMTGEALAPVLANLYGADRNAFHLSVDYSWGWSQQESIAQATEAQGWRTVANKLTKLSDNDFGDYIQLVIDSDADVLVLNQFGKNLLDSLASSVQARLRDRVVNGHNFEIIAPVHSSLVARNAGDNIKGVFGTVNWHWTLQNEGSKAFVRSYVQEYGFPPTQAAHVSYCQTLLYADACQRAGTFNPCGVIEALEGFDFDGLGNGPTHYRAADHQCFKDVLVVKGKENPDNEFDLLEIVEITPRAQIEYPADHPMFTGGTLGSCNDG